MASLSSMGFFKACHHLLWLRLAIVVSHVALGMDDRIMSHVALGINVCESGVELNSNTQNGDIIV